MTGEGFKHKLTAILSADVEGYSRLMDDDEEATVRTLKPRVLVYLWLISYCFADFTCYVYSFECISEFELDTRDGECDIVKIFQCNLDFYF